ncbi:MAG: NADH-quinone oxidoreductase subunit NuoH [Caldimicrobium sp.]|nr:NADH-quinone oxidoreductase subunit NuoH [Caldimicrobium sp.]MCX7874269.1 NADH-quinone oxidoreductase subunit NuoH [Caldimicrobium sp.]MDW8093924.1 NADH-quinone oxidoreductase subunit NuoH [Caldimicrobium sp.]
MGVALWSEIVILVAVALLLLLVALFHVAYLTYAERKIIARMQQRLGPNRVGPRGLLQPIADVLKLLHKEDIIPYGVDKPIFHLAPLVSLVCAASGLALIPLWDTFVLSNLNVGLLFLLALSSLSAYGVILSGWASNSRYAFLGALRASAQLISYEIAMSLALLSVVLMAGSFNLQDIVKAQMESPFKAYIIPQIIAFFIFMVSAIAETNRVPFDLPEAETELVAGYFVEYSGIRFALFYLAEYFGMVVMCALAVTCFLGGYIGPFNIPGLPFFWFLLKLYVLLFFYIWVRATLPRYRYDQLMGLGWKVLIPLGLLNLFFTALLKLWL